MSNRTELMKKILKSEQAQKIIDEISPVYGESYVCLWLFQIIGKELDKLDDFVQNLREQTVIQTADQWALKYWEEQYGEIEAPHLPEEKRRQNIPIRKRKRGMIFFFIIAPLLMEKHLEEEPAQRAI